METEVKEMPRYFKEVIGSMMHNKSPLSIEEISQKVKSVKVSILEARDLISWILMNAPEYVEIFPAANNKPEKYKLKVSGDPDVIIKDLKMKVGIPIKDTPIERSKIRSLKIIKYMMQSGEEMTAKEMSEYVGGKDYVGFSLKDKIISAKEFFQIIKTTPADKYKWNPANEVTPEHVLKILYPEKSKKEEIEKKINIKDEDFLELIKTPRTAEELISLTGKSSGAISGRLFRLKGKVNIKIGTKEEKVSYQYIPYIPLQKSEGPEENGLGEKRKIDRSLSKPEQTARELIIRIKDDIKCVNAFRKPGKSTYTFDKDYKGNEIESWTKSRKEWLDSEINDIFRSKFEGIEMPIHGIATIEYEMATINIIYSEKGNHVMTITWN